MTFIRPNTKLTCNTAHIRRKNAQGHHEKKGTATHNVGGTQLPIQEKLSSNL
jgi:hypothetical protein